jgi:hypothetical protein
VNIFTRKDKIMKKSKKIDKHNIKNKPILLDKNIVLKLDNV